MIVELIIFALAIALFYRMLKAMPGKANPAVVAKQPQPTGLTELVVEAGRLFKDRQWSQAEQAYLKILKEDHRNAAAYARLGLVYNQLKQPADAVECFRVAAQLEPSQSNYYFLGNAYFSNQNYIKSIAAYEKGLMFEASVAGYLALAKAQQKIANFSKAVAALEKAVELEESKRTLSALADAYAAMLERAKAEEAYRRVLQLDPSDPKASRIVGT